MQGAPVAVFFGGQLASGLPEKVEPVTNTRQARRDQRHDRRSTAHFSLFTSTAEEIAKSAAPQQVPAAARNQRFSAISLIKTLRTNESDVKTQQQREEHRHR